MKKVILMLMVIVLTFGFAAFASAGDTTATGEVGIYSNFVSRGIIYSDGLVIQPAATLTSGDFVFITWANYDPNEMDAGGDSEGRLNETDLIAAYAFDTEVLSFEIGYIYYGYVAFNDTQEVYVTASYDATITPTVSIYYDFDEVESTYVETSLSYTKELLGMPTTFEGLVSYFDSSSYSSLHHGQISASMEIPTNDEMTIIPMVAYSTALTDKSESTIEATSLNGKSNFIYGGVMLSSTF